MTQLKRKNEIAIEGHHRRPIVFALAMGILTVAGCEDQEVMEAASDSGQNVQTERQALNAYSEDSMWPAGMIPVCWESRRYSTERRWVEDAIRDTWEATGHLFTYGWERCPSGWFDGIRIAWEDTTPVCSATSNGRGGEDGLILNRVFDHYRASQCQTSEAARRACIEATAVHEFGHAIGYAHEQARTDTPDWCSRGKEHFHGRVYPTDVWDVDSVMNYCNPEWGEDFPPALDDLLSTHDIQGTIQFYPNRQGDGILPIQDIAVAGSDNGRLSVFANMGDKLYHKQQTAAGRTSSKWPETSTNPWTSWKVLGSPNNTDLTKSIATARHTDDRIYAFVTNVYGELHYAKQTGVDSPEFYWSHPGSSPVLLKRRTPLAAANYPDGGIAVFGIGTDDKLTVAKRTGYRWSVETLGDMEIGSNLAVGTKPNGRLMAFTAKDGYLFSLSQNSNGSWESSWRLDFSALPLVNTTSSMVSGINSRNNLQVFFGMSGSAEGEIWSVEYANDGLYYDRVVSQGDVCVAGTCSSRTARSASIGAGKRSDGRLVVAYFQDQGINAGNKRSLYVEEQADGSWSDPGFFPTYGQSAFRGDRGGEEIVCTNYTTSWNKLGCFSFLNRDPERHGEYFVTAIYEKSSMPNGYTPWFFLSLDYSESGY